MIRRCDNCAFYDPNQTAGHDHGYCRLNPPKVMQVVQQESQYYTQFENTLPCVHKTAWCGQHKTGDEFHGA